jgi:CRISPR-associated protein Csb1
MPEVRIDQFDGWLQDNGPAALLFHRTLLPIEGKQAWIFPPTFAQSESAGDEDEGGGDYQIDPLLDDPRRNVCLIDSVGSQANRMEPIFKREPYAALVPRRVVEMNNGDEVNLLDAGHRAADAAVRFSKKLGPKLWAAFNEIKKNGDCSSLSKLAPTSLVFGVWDSRATGVKIQRIVRSVIRAYDVLEARRSATYQAAYDYTVNGVISPDHDKGSGKNNPLSQEGFKYSLATRTHGGVLARGEIRQEAIINLVALRTLTRDINLERYLLGLALVALSYRDQQCFNLREGCLLRAASRDDYEGNWKAVSFDGTEINFDGKDARPAPIDHAAALQYAAAARQHMTFETSEPDQFDTETAEAWLAVDKKERKNLAKTMHPAAALARRRNKQAEEDAKNPVDGALRVLKAVKLGTRPKEGKPRKILTDKFEPLKDIFQTIINDDSAEQALKTLASEILNLIREDTDSHALRDELTKRLEDFRTQRTQDDLTTTTDRESGQ